MGLYAVIKNEYVQNIAVSDGPLATDGEWVRIDDVTPTPNIGWKYESGAFSESVITTRVPKFKFVAVLADVMSGIEAAAQTDTEVTSWLEKYNASEEFEFNEAYDADLSMLKSKGLIDGSHVDKLRPCSPFY